MPQEQRQRPRRPNPPTGQAGAPTFTLDNLARARLVAQLTGPVSGTAVEAVRWLTAIQAQDFASALTSVGLRTATRLRAEVIAAIDEGEIVRSWPMRGTLHLTAAEDLPWMVQLLAPRVIKTSVARRSTLGLDEPQLHRACELTTAVLSGGRRLRRSDLFATWERAGLNRGGERGTHILRYLAMTGTVVLGPTDGTGEQLVVLLDEWVPQPPTPRA